MNCDEIFERIALLEKEYIGFWTDICNIESPTNHKEGVDRVGGYVMEKARDRGWQIEVQRQEVSGDCICITMNPHAAGAPVCVSGHMDTVHPLGSFGDTPVSMDGEKIYGPGVADCKGGIAAGFLAMAALEDCGFNARPVKLILQSDEENSSATSNKTTVDFMCKCAEGSAAFLNCEPNVYNTAVLARKGILKYSFHVTGKAAHAGICYDGVSAIAEAAYKIIELEKYKDENGITCNCGLISGGTAVNTVPGECTFAVDVRFSDDAEMAAADKFIREIAERSYVEGTSCSVTLMSRRDAMELTDTNIALLEKANVIFSRNGLPTLEKRITNGGSDAAYITQCGIPCVDSVGVTGTYIHRPEEQANLDSLTQAAKRIAAICMCIDF